MISKKKFAENNDPIQIMIKTVHKVSHDMRNPLNAIINM
jgi:signal transduction histidine kinase